MASLGLYTPALQRRAREIADRVGGDLYYFTLLSNLTTLCDHCQFAVAEGGALAARYVDLPFTAVSFYGQGSGLRRVLCALVGKEHEAYTLVGEAQLALLEPVVRVLEIEPEWQMVFDGDLDQLAPGSARRLVSGDGPAMSALAELCGMFAFAPNALDKGPCFGGYAGPELVAMAGTHLSVMDMTEVGNVATHPEYRRQGWARQALSALVQHLCHAGQTVFLQVFETNGAAIALYEKLGFVRRCRMYLVRFEL